MRYLFLSIVLLPLYNLFGYFQAVPDIDVVRVVWKYDKPSGEIEVINGSIEAIKVLHGAGSIESHTFNFESTNDNAIAIAFDSIRIQPGSGATLVTINSDVNGFSFFLRDVNSSHPIYIPEYNVIVLPGEDPRSYAQVEESIMDAKYISKVAEINMEPEESFEKASLHTRDQSVPTWLGISRDIRLFEISQSLETAPFERDVISPRNAYEPIYAPGEGQRVLNYSFVLGRGQGVQADVKRRLKEGILPILCTEKLDGGISYSTEMFASLEYSELNTKGAYGTDFWIADHHLAGRMFTDSQQNLVNEKLGSFRDSEREQTVLFSRTIVKNLDKVPRYAWIKIPSPGKAWWDQFNYKFDQGFSRFADNSIFLISKLNGKPIANEEMAILLQPDDSITMEFFLPHNPISASRAEQLMSQTFEKKLAETQIFWQDKLNNASKITLPEKRIEEMVRAGLLNLDQLTYGQEPEGALAPSIGIYAPIGTESAPIIQFYMSVGLFDEARRTLRYFLEKQHENGMIQNFGGYMVETGAVLWSIGEYYRYTKDVHWIESIKPQLIKSCNFLLDWRNENKRPELKDRGYGLIAGKVADPDDPYHQFMLNGYGYMGLSRIAEILHPIDSVLARDLKGEAQAWKQDILTSFRYSMAHSPVVPEGDGSWCPTVGPWTEGIGPRSLYVDPEKSYSHGTFTVADVLLGPLYLIFCEVLNYNEPEAKMLLDYHQELFYKNNSAFSQPYYSRHNWVQLKRGLVKPFLKTYYNTFSALADRETYAFWEHVYHASPYKTHEQAWFLMETRWMLWHEEESTLKLLSTIPRRWLENGETILLDSVASYFGPVSLDVQSEVDDGLITAEITCSSQQADLESVIIRLPHPTGKKPTMVSGGAYNEAREEVTISPFSGYGKVILKY